MHGNGQLKCPYFGHIFLPASCCWLQVCQNLFDDFFRYHEEAGPYAVAAPVPLSTTCPLC
eukprot:1158298-Pelagomonas_calceolata.AAC.10